MEDEYENETEEENQLCMGMFVSGIAAADVKLGEFFHDSACRPKWIRRRCLLLYELYPDQLSQQGSGHAQ